MAKELEKKYKLLYMPDESIRGTVKFIEQAYLMFDGKKQLRVRITDGKESVITYKDSITDEDRDEFEYPIPLKDARELFEKAKFKLTKHRYSFQFGVFHVDIDLLPNGKEVAELEAKDLKDLVENPLPYFCGEEVTKNPEYSNIVIAKSL